MSFSGLKTAVRIASQELAPLTKQDASDICASFQNAVGKVLVNRLGRAIERFESESACAGGNLVIAGGVSANLYLRKRIDVLCKSHGWNMIAPPLELCGDNAAMIAWAGLEQFEAGHRSPMDFKPRSRWPLDEESQAIVGGGRRGVKA